MKIKSRKQARKELRKAKKIRKHEFFMKKRAKFKSSNTSQKTDCKIERPKKQKNTNEKEVIKENIAKVKGPKKIKQQQSPIALHNNVKQPQDRIEKERQREKKLREKLDRDIEKTRIEKLRADNEREEIEIKKLEKQMKLRKGKSKAFVLDGLDYLLDVCDKKISNNKFEETFEESDSEFENDYKNIVGETNEDGAERQSKRKKSNDQTEVNPHDDDISMGSDDDGDDDDDDVDDNSADSYDFDNSEDDLQNMSDCSDVNSSSEIEDDSKDTHQKGNKKCVKRKHQKSVNEKTKKKKEAMSPESGSSECSQTSDNESETETQNEGNQKLWEDIYGRTRDQSGNVVNTYVPPHLRPKTEGANEKSTEALQKLKRQIKGLLNRLAESNMVYISNQIEELYMNNSRNDMNKTMFALFQDSLFVQVLIPERLISEHAMLIGILHANVGSEIGAYFLQHAVLKFTKDLERSQETADKTVNNLLLFIMHMYNLQLFHCKLMYDLINLLLENPEEKQIELILLALKTVGLSMRKNDPIALKNLIIKMQQQVNKVQNSEDSSRMKFMLELLMAIKNNNMSKIPNYDPEFVEKLRKSFKLFVRKGNYATELNISHQDLMNAETQGRWWIVGSAWSGPMPQSGTESSKRSESDVKFRKKLLDLAKAQRMNTDVRRNVFCILMSSEDFLEAFEKLIKLKLKGSVEREIMNVMLHCALQEKNWNPYYMHLGNKFCQFDRKYQIMLQCAIWDKIKEMKDLLPVQVTNLAKFVGHTVLEGGLPISVLKVIEFSELDKRSVKFMRQVLLTILLNKDENAVAAVFRRIVESAKLKLFRESLRLFLQHFLLKNTKNIDKRDMTKLTKMVKLCENALVSYDGGF